MLQLYPQLFLDWSLGENWVKTWDTHLPGWEETPGKVNIQVIL
ncbi:MAG: hypothetical protein ACK5GT_13775 [Aphanizomenon sp.]